MRFWGNMVWIILILVNLIDLTLKNKDNNYGRDLTEKRYELGFDCIFSRF